MRILIASTVLMSSAAAALAEPSARAIERQTLESFASNNATCHEWTDGCAVCARQGDARFACSLPGIACEPRAVACSDAGAPASAPRSQ